MKYDYQFITLICDADYCKKFNDKFRKVTIEEVLIRYEKNKDRIK